MTADQPVVLVVEDEPDVAETYEVWLAEEYDVRRATNGQEALEMVDGVDVVLLDRIMPGMSGAEVLTELRERGHDCAVAMVTAVDPDFDVLEMGFDTYVVKPTTREELYGTIDALLDRATHDEQVQQYYSLAARRAALEANKPRAELDASDEYAELEARIEDLQESLGETFTDLDEEGFRAAFHSFSTEQDADAPK